MRKKGLGYVNVEIVENVQGNLLFFKNILIHISQLILIGRASERGGRGRDRGEGQGQGEAFCPGHPAHNVLLIENI